MPVIQLIIKPDVAYVEDNGEIVLWFDVPKGHHIRKNWTGAPADISKTGVQSGDAGIDFIVEEE